MKKCIKCGKAKQIEEFNRRNECRLCKAEYSKKYAISLNGKLMQMYRSQKHSSKLRGHHPPSYKRDEFIDWMLNNEDYLRLHAEWAKSGYKKELSPSVDRLDDYKGYSFDNIQVTTWGENEIKGRSDRKNGINNKHSKAVVKCDLNGVELDSYHSMNNAARETGIEHASIWRACNGKYKTAGGFKWRYLTN